MRIRKTKYILCISLIALTCSCTCNYYLVRHAEKADGSRDPDLSTEGNQRALALRDSLLSKNIREIFVTNYKRTQQTAAPLAEQLHLEPVIIDASQTDFTVDQIKKSKHKDILIVGHSNTIPAIIDKLMSGPQKIQINDDDYDNLFHIKITRRKRSMLFKASYGHRTH